MYSSPTTRFGLALPQIGELASPAAIIEVAKAADDRGYSSVWALDRLLAPIESRTPYPASPDGELPAEQRLVLDPLGTLTLAAAVTERVRLGTSVLVAPWYAPAVLARSLTTLDHISSGRLTVGLGLGWSVDEYEAVGVKQQRLGITIQYGNYVSIWKRKKDGSWRYVLDTGNATPGQVVIQ